MAINALGFPLNPLSFRIGRLLMAKCLQTVGSCMYQHVVNPKNAKAKENRHPSLVWSRENVAADDVFLGVDISLFCLVVEIIRALFPRNPCLSNDK